MGEAILFWWRAVGENGTVALVAAATPERAMEVMQWQDLTGARLTALHAETLAEGPGAAETSQHQAWELKPVDLPGASSCGGRLHHSHLERSARAVAGTLGVAFGQHLTVMRTYVRGRWFGPIPFSRFAAALRAGNLAFIQRHRASWRSIRPKKPQRLAWTGAA
jgi:hypothetical protein